MPIEQHPHLRLPPRDTALWRHLDLAKFLALLEDEALWFARLDMLSDPYEGLPPRSVLEDTWNLPPELSDQDRQYRLEVARHNTRVYSESPRHLYVSCWYAAPVESAAMWRLYSPADAGLAIRTTLQRLDESLGESTVTLAGGIHGGLVRYVDFETFRPASHNLFDWASLKRESFNHEHEFRLIAFPGQELAGFKVSVDVGRLVHEVWVAPTAPEWHKEIVSKVCARYGLKAPVRQSELLAHPSYFQTPSDADA